MKELFKKLQKYEIKIRKAVNTSLQGDMHSVFKGTGLDFDDVRAYQYGDDVRSIDWNVSAKGHGVFVKTYKEDREQAVFFLVDLSGSQEIGQAHRQKLDLVKELAGVLSLSALKEGSRVGLLGFTDQKELYIKPGKGTKHGYLLIDQLFNKKPEHKKTDLKKAILTAQMMMKRKSLVFLISDFIDDDYEESLKALAHRHDLILVHVSDKMETSLPSLGIVPVRDTETGKMHWVNTSSPGFRKKYAQRQQKLGETLSHFARKNRANYISIFTDEDYVPSLVKFFRVRNKAKQGA